MTSKKVTVTVSANILIRNEIKNLDPLIRNLIDARVDELVFLDGGSTDGSWELLQQWAKEDPRIVALQWPQKNGTEYKKEFKEVARRNLMIEASSSDYILYIDADERISLDFKNSIDRRADCTAISRITYWNGLIRENGPNDRVWRPDMNFRIFKREKNLSFRSNDKNGLHTFLSWRGFKIPLGVTRGGYHIYLAKLLRIMLGIRGHIPVKPPIIFHYHYFDLQGKKVNDLRGREFNWKIEIDTELSLRTQENTVYATSVDNDVEAFEITKRYWT